MREYPNLCFDRVLPQDLNRPQRLMSMGGPGSPSRAIIVIRKMWLNGSPLRVRFLGGTSGQQKMVSEHATQWSQFANLNFQFTDAPDAEIRVAFDPNDGAWSYVGTDCRNIPQGQPTLNLGWVDEGVILHEFGHAIGLGHEHQNPAGGIVWNEDVVIRDLAGSPNFWTPEQTRHNVLDKYAADQIRGTDFDRESVMLYFFPDTWVKSGRGTKENNRLSAQDKAFIASSQAYPRAAAPTALDLPVIDTTGVEASIGQAGEEDQFTFTAPRTGRYTVETGGQTDVVMKLFGPDSPTALIAEDDDGGEGNNSRIVVDLMPGKYFVQVRHYNRTNGTGAYTIKVMR